MSFPSQYLCDLTALHVTHWSLLINYRQGLLIFIKRRNLSNISAKIPVSPQTTKDFISICCIAPSLFLPMIMKKCQYIDEIPFFSRANVPITITIICFMWNCERGDGCTIHYSKLFSCFNCSNAIWFSTTSKPTKKKSANVKNWCKGKRAALKKSEVSSSHRKVFMDARSICIKIEKLHKVADQQTRTL